ncbi:neural cell adhesion molecule 2-like [Planococcus citri]|uniref:neural cell adhesion molecule 2-like n=1 Tax=Planococcus citri TaxID=170843 RepID=UPI0031F7DCAA
MFNDVRTSFYVALSVVCCVYSNYGYETSTKNLILYPPWLVTYRYVNENYRVVCTCYEAYHQIKWTRLNDGFIIPENGKKIYTQHIQKTIALVFPNITKDQEGDYECTAFDKNKNIKYTNQFTLNVEEPIVFEGPTVYEVVTDETVVLKCEVNEKLALKRHWEFNGNVLHPEDRIQYESEGLRIPEVKLSDAGKYYCVISHWPFQSTCNRLEITLIVYYKPVARTVSNVTYGFVDEVVPILCEVNANPNPWFIWYNKHKEPLNPKNDNVSITIRNDTSTLMVTLSESLMETWFICEACNELGCTPQTIQVKKTTKLRTPVLGLWDIDSDSAEFYVSTQSEASLYIFQYFFDVDEDMQWGTPFEKNFSTILPRAKMDSYMRYEVDELHPDTNYILRVASANQFTKSEFSEERRFKTRIGRTVHTICNICSRSKSCSFVLLLPFINTVSLKNIFY